MAGNPAAGPRGSVLPHLVGGLAGLGLGWASLLLPPVARALSFHYLCVSDPTCASFNPQAYAGFQAAGARWSALFADPITVRIKIGFSSLGGSILGQAGSTDNLIPYTIFRNALEGDRRSADDHTAYGTLTTDPDVDLWINYTANNPSGTGSAIPYLDNNGGANNTSLRVNTANLKAVGLAPDYTGVSDQTDALIQFSSDFIWDFDPSDGIGPGSFDFIGVASHEIGHALGFVSGVDVLDEESPYQGNYFTDDSFDFVTSLDLFRYSAGSANAGVIDWTADTRDKYFSLNRGLASLGSFSTGVNHGDGRQASHWKDNLALGLMDPTLASGELGLIRPLDVQALDVIGYDVAVAPAPLPLLGAAAAHAWSRRLRRRLRERQG